MEAKSGRRIALAAALPRRRTSLKMIVHRRIARGISMPRRTLLLSLTMCWIAVVCSGAIDPFVGKWKLNASRSQLADQMTIQPAGKNTYTLIFGGSGETETVAADGTDQPGMYGTSVSITLEQDGAWKIVRKKKGQMVLSAVWNLSKDGKTLTDVFTSYQPDGSTSTVTMAYRRAAGDAGIPGTWETTDVKLDAGYELEIRSFDGNGLSFISPASPSPKNVRFDGGKYPYTAGMGVGAECRGRRIDPLDLELTDTVGGNILDTRRMTLTPDLKALTIVVHPAGQHLPNTLVFDRD
jgi:VCBS repeat-containing protein